MHILYMVAKREEQATERLVTPVRPKLLARIEDFRYARRIPSRAEAVRRCWKKPFVELKAASQTAANHHRVSRLPPPHAGEIFRHLGRADRRRDACVVFGLRLRRPGRPWPQGSEVLEAPDGSLVLWRAPLGPCGGPGPRAYVPAPDRASRPRHASNISLSQASRISAIAGNHLAVEERPRTGSQTLAATGSGYRESIAVAAARNISGLLASDAR